MTDNERRESQQNDQQLGSNAYNALLSYEPVDIDLAELDEGDWLTIKEKFTLKEIGEESLQNPIYAYNGSGKALYERFSFSWRVPLEKTPLIVHSVDTENNYIEVAPRGLIETPQESMHKRFRKKKGSVTYKIDAKILVPMRGHPMQTIKIKDALMEDLMKIRSLKRLNERKIIDILAEEGDLTLKEIEDKYSR